MSKPHSAGGRLLPAMVDLTVRSIALAVPVAVMLGVVAGLVLVTVLPAHAGCQKGSDGTVGYVCHDGNAYAIPALVAIAGLVGVSELVTLAFVARGVDPRMLRRIAGVLETSAAVLLVAQCCVAIPVIARGGYSPWAVDASLAVAAWGVLLIALRRMPVVASWAAAVVTFAGLLAVAWEVFLLAPLIVAVAFGPLVAAVLRAVAARSSRPVLR